METTGCLTKVEWPREEVKWRGQLMKQPGWHPREMGLEVSREHLSRMTQYEECEGGAGEAVSPVLTEETENYRV